MPHTVDTEKKIALYWELVERLYGLDRSNFPEDIAEEECFKLGRDWVRHWVQTGQVKSAPTAPITREQVEALKVGDYRAYTPHTAHGIPVENAAWSEPREILEIHHKGEDINGKLFACFYVEFGETARISGSVKEGDRSIVLFQ